jgi:hypothetical protein
VPRSDVDPSQTLMQQVSRVLFVEVKQSENEPGRFLPSSSIIYEPLFSCVRGMVFEHLNSSTCHKF